jgi:hypothetical protein
VKLRAVTAIVIAAVCGALLIVGTSFATNWTTSDNSYKAGDSDVWFHQCAMQANTHDAFHANDSHDIEPTAITTHLTAAHDACGTEDVRINDFAYGTDDPTGWYECHDFHSAQNCDKGHAHINTSYSNIPEDYQRTLRLVCEEIGHSVGLGHSGDSDSCMSASTAAHLTSHDKGHLNNNY